jgi:hypothetical protein
MNFENYEIKIPSEEKFEFIKTNINKSVIIYDEYDDFYVLRKFRITETVFREIARLYISKENIKDCELYATDFKYTKLKNGYKLSKHQSIIKTPYIYCHYSEYIIDCGKLFEEELRYYKELINYSYKEDKQIDFLTILYNSIKYPWIEKLAKAECYNFLIEIFCSINWDVTMKNTIEVFTGKMSDEDFESEDIERIFYCSFKILKLLDPIIYKCYFGGIQFFKEVLEEDYKYIFSLDKDTILKLFEFVSEFMGACGNCTYDSDFFNIIKQKWGTKTVIKVMLYLYENYDILNFYEYEYTLYCNYVSMCIKEDLKCELYINVDELTNMQDLIVSYWNEQEYPADLFIKNNLSWNEYLYKNDTYAIIQPEKPIDIIKEGIELRHCVSTFVDKILEKQTIILFIRKLNNIEKPFFTLEIKNNEIRQCHGLCNSNIDTEPGLEEFLKEYCKEKNIKYNSGKELFQ